jgi:hypothetical protein
MIAVVVISAVLILLLRDVLFGDARSRKAEAQQPAKSGIVFHGTLLLVGSVFGLLAGLLYSYFTHGVIRWGTYVGMLVPMSLFAVALWVYWLRQRRRRTHS